MASHKATTPTTYKKMRNCVLGHDSTLGGYSVLQNFFYGSCPWCRIDPKSALCFSMKWMIGAFGHEWILLWIMPLVQDLSLGLSSPAYYHCTATLSEHTKWHRNCSSHVWKQTVRQNYKTTSKSMPNRRHIKQTITGKKTAPTYATFLEDHKIPWPFCLVMQ